jgi:hypothetical protein
MSTEAEAHGSQQLVECQRPAINLLRQDAEIFLEVKQEVDERFVLGRHDDHQRSPTILHFLKRLRSALAGFFNLSRWQILGFGRHLPGNRLSVGVPGRNV